MLYLLNPLNMFYYDFINSLLGIALVLFSATSGSIVAIGIGGVGTSHKLGAV